MRNRCYVGNVHDLETDIVQRTHGRLTSGPGAANHDVEVLPAELEGPCTGPLGCHLRRKRGAFARAAETGASGRGPGQRIALAVSDGNDGVVKRGIDMRDAVGNRAFNFLSCFRFSPYLNFRISGLLL